MLFCCSRRSWSHTCPQILGTTNHCKFLEDTNLIRKLDTYPREIPIHSNSMQYLSNLKKLNLFQCCNRNPYSSLILYNIMYCCYNSTLTYNHYLSQKIMYSCEFFFLSQASLFCYSSYIFIIPSLPAMGLQWFHLSVVSAKTSTWHLTLSFLPQFTFLDEVDLPLLLHLVSHSSFFHAQTRFCDDVLNFPSQC